MRLKVPASGQGDRGGRLVFFDRIGGPAPSPARISESGQRRLGCGALTGPVASRFRQPAPPRVRGAIPPCGHLSLSRVYVSDIDVWRTVETAAWIRSGAGIRSP